MEGKLITRIRPSSGWTQLNISELIEYKDLLWFLTLRGIKAKYAQSVLGVGWAVIQPLFTTLIFTIVFGNLAKITSDGTPYFIFSLTGMVAWNYFSGTLTESTNSLVANAGMISKVYFPRLVLPLSAVLSKLLDFIIGFLLLIVFLFVYQIPATTEVFVLPLLMLLLLMTSIGIGMILSAMAVQYRDVKHVMTFLTQLLMYAAPVVYPASAVPDQFKYWYALNPMVGVIEGFRAALLHTRPMPWDFIGIGALVALLVFVYGAFYFKRMERVFADVA